MNEDYSDIWEMYGIRTNPFFTDPLLLFGGNIDVKLGFVGREEEVKRLQSLVGSRGGIRVIVTGDVGVGKTTFVNYVRAMAPDKVFFTPLREIATQPEWTGVDFILNTLSAIYNTLKLRTDLGLKLIEASIRKKLELLVDVVEQKDKSFAIDILGSGGSIGSSTIYNIPAMTINALNHFFEQVIEEIKRLGYREIILNYNNLELLDSNQIQKLFNSIRDFIQHKDVKFIFIGGFIVPQVVSKHVRIQSIMSESPIVLLNLSIKEVRELLEKRIRYLAISGLEAAIPYEDDVISKLYTLYEGNLRYILNSLSEAFNYMIKDTPIIMTSEELVKILPELARRRWLNKLTEGEKEVLMCILREKQITNKRIAEILHKRKQNISPVTNKLKEICAIKVKEDGKERYFSVQHSIKWFLLEEAKKEDKVNKKMIDRKNLNKEVQQIIDKF